MTQKTSLGAFAFGLMLATQASAVTINFDNLAAGTVLSNQYAGVTFTPNAFSGPGSSTSGKPWSTKTDMTIVDSAGSDAGDVGTPLLVSGNILRSFAGWFRETDGDPSFRISFATPVNSFSAAFAGVSTPEDVTIWLFNGATQIGTVSGAAVNVVPAQFVLSFAAASITSVAIRPGSFEDWVGVDNINYTTAPVPEASTYAMMALGLGMLALRRRRA
jgi:PEP-CTERM motif